MPNISKKPDDELLKSAAARVKRGASRDKVAKELGISRRTLNRYIEPHLSAQTRAHAPDEPPGPVQAPASPAQPPARAPGAEPTMREELTASRELAVQVRDRLIAQAEEAEARKWGQEVARYDNLIMRLDRLEDRDALVIPSSQVTAIQRMAFARLDAMAASGPVVCAHCRRNVAADWARQPMVKKEEQH